MRKNIELANVRFDNEGNVCFAANGNECVIASHCFRFIRHTPHMGTLELYNPFNPSRLSLAFNMEHDYPEFRYVLAQHVAEHFARYYRGYFA